jgi:hypothetical protein
MSRSESGIRRRRKKKKKEEEIEVRRRRASCRRARGKSGFGGLVLLYQL